MDDCSRKFDFLSQSTGTRSRMEINFNEHSRKLLCSEPHLKTINDSRVEFMGETCSQPHLKTINDSRVEFMGETCSQPQLKNINDSPIEFLGETNPTYFESDEAQQSSVGNGDEDRLFEQESNLSAQRAAEEFEKKCDEKVNSEGGQNIEVMFNTYKQLGNELERKLLTLGDKNALQRNQLSQCMRDYEYLIKQREKNKKSLVDLQIKMENLDSLKQCAKNDYEIDKKQKSENIGQLFQTLFANDEYIKNTQNKFKDELLNDTKRFSSLIIEIKEEISNQKHLGNKYFQEMNNLYAHYESIVKSSNEQESNIDLKLDYIVQRCHLCKGEKEAKESELKNLGKMFEELQNRIAEVKQKKELLQDELAKIINEHDMLREHCTNDLNQIRNEVKNLTERYNTMYESGKALSQELDEREKLVAEGTRKYTELIELIENVGKEKLSLLNELNKKELNIHNLKVDIENVRQSQLINSQINDLVRVEEDLLSKKLNIEKCIELKCNETEKIKKVIEGNEILLNDILIKSSQQSQRKLELNEMYNATCKLLEEAKTKLISSISTEKLGISEKRLKEVEDLFSKHKEKLKILNSELEYLENVNINLMNENDDILGKQTSIAERENILLMEKDEQKRRLLSLENLKKYLLDLEDDYITLLNSKEAKLVLNELKEKLDKIISDHNVEEQFNNIQLNSISDSFNSQLKNLNNQMKILKIENEEAVKKKISQNTRYQKVIPRIEEAIQSAKNLISEKIPSLIECIDKRLEYMNKLIEVYKAASLEFKNSGGNNVDAKVVMNSIEKTLGNVMENMLAIYEGPKLNASENIDKYQQIFANVRKKYFNLQSEMKAMPATQVVTKLTELAECIYGGLGFPQKTSMNESVLSSQRTLTSEDTIF